jgi:hypothetical protein
MTLFKRLAKGGPVGLAHALREAWTAHRIRSVARCLDQERELHREHMAQLQSELRRLVLRQACTTQRAAAFWREL